MCPGKSLTETWVMNKHCHYCDGSWSLSWSLQLDPFTSFHQIITPSTHSHQDLKVFFSSPTEWSFINNFQLYLICCCFSAAVSYTVAEQFDNSIEMEAITRSSRIGRSDGEKQQLIIGCCWAGRCFLNVSNITALESSHCFYYNHIIYWPMLGTCHHMECPIADGRLREVTDWLAGFEEMLGYIVNSVSTSLG